MFSSLFSASAPVDPTAPNFHPVSSRYEAKDLYGPLEARDTEWACTTSGFVTETQTWYTIADDDTQIMTQVIHSAVGVWYPTIQFVCRVYNAKTGLSVWKSINVTNFVAKGRSSSADEFTITHASSDSEAQAESYNIRANLGTDLQINLVVSRPAAIPGFKVGADPKGGFSYFGVDEKEAFVVHRFWPRFQATGHVVHNGTALPISGPGMFIHAIQGMRPNLVAQSWNFAHFQSSKDEGPAGAVSAIQMEFKTLTTHGRNGPGSGGVYVNVGSLVIGGKLVAVSAETKWPDAGPRGEEPVMSRAVHLKPTLDEDTTYHKPTGIVFRWKGPLIDGEGSVEGKVQVDLGAPGKDTEKGLIEKIDILGEIPYVIKMAVNYTGTKPFMYQWANPATITINGPDSIVDGLSKGIEVQGTLYNEATFIS